MLLRNIKTPPSTTRYDTVLMRGGIDMMTPLSMARPGVCRDALNFEQDLNGGYRRISGYEKFSGKQKPSETPYFVFQLSGGLPTNQIFWGQTITGATSGATAIALEQYLSASTTIQSYTNVVGTFQAGENVQVGGVTKGTIANFGGTVTSDPYYRNRQRWAVAEWQAVINHLPVGSGGQGVGPILGLCKLNGVLYAFRNDALNSSARLWKSSPAGWVEIPMGFEFAFKDGSVAPKIGETFVNVSWGFSCVVTGVALETGTWAGGTAAGRFTAVSYSGGIGINTPLSGSQGGVMTTGTLGYNGPTPYANKYITHPANGRYEFDRGNFGGVNKIYGVNGAGQAFEFDGTALIPIRTGQTNDAPHHVCVHSDHLFLSFGDNLQAQGIGNPFASTAGSGAIAFRCGGPITSLFRQAGVQDSGSLGITTTNGTEFLYGTSAANFKRVAFEESAGARPGGTQRMGGLTLVYGDMGVTSIRASQDFGNFSSAALTQTIIPFTNTHRHQCVGSVVNREKSQYRVFFADGSAIYMTLNNGRVVGSMLIRFNHAPTAVCAGDETDARDTAFFGDKDGWVYELDKGDWFHNQAIESYITLSFADQGNVRVNKRYTGLTIDAIAENYTTYKVSYELDFGNTDRPAVTRASPLTEIISLVPDQWDGGSDVDWDERRAWDGRNMRPSNIEIRGTGENLSVTIEQNYVYAAPFTVHSMTVHYRVRSAYKKAA